MQIPAGTETAKAGDTERNLDTNELAHTHEFVTSYLSATDRPTVIACFF